MNFDPKLYPHIFNSHVGRNRKIAERGGEKLIFLGQNMKTGSPISIPLRLLFEHAMFLGHPGSGKTSRQAALAVQIIGLACATVVIADLKGDPFLFHSVREACLYAGLRFRWLTNRVGHPTFAYNPLSQSHLAYLTISQRVQAIIRALGLVYGEVYGGSWFESAMERFLNNLITYYEKSLYAFREFAFYCDDPVLYTMGEQRLGSVEDWKDARHVHNEIRRLAENDQCNITARTKSYPPEVFENAIDAAQLFSEPQVVYLNLASASESTWCRNITKLLLYGLLQVGDMLAAAKEGGTRVRSVPVIFLIDEFSEIASNTFLPVLAQARSRELGLVMGLQSLHQLDMGDKKLSESFFSTVGYKHVFSAPDRSSKEYLVSTSGETTELAASWEQQIPSGSRVIAPHMLGPERAVPFVIPFGDPLVRVQPTKRPRLSMDDVSKNGAEPFSSYVHFASNTPEASFDGLWTPVWSGFHVDAATYERRQREPFPGQEPGTMIVPHRSEYSRRYERPDPQQAVQSGQVKSVDEIMRGMQEDKP